MLVVARGETTVVRTVVAVDETRYPPLHERTESYVGGRFHDNVEMIGNEAEAENFEREFHFWGGEQVEKCGLVALLMEDRSAPVSLIEHVVGIAGHLSSRNPKHKEAR